MADQQELERLFVKFLGDDSALESMYTKIVERARQKAGEVGKAFTEGFSSTVSQEASKAMEEAVGRAADAASAAVPGFADLRKQMAEVRTVAQQVAQQADVITEGLAEQARQAQAAAQQQQDLQQRIRDLSAELRTAQQDYRGGRSTAAEYGEAAERLGAELAKLREEQKLSAQQTAQVASAQTAAEKALKQSADTSAQIAARVTELRATMATLRNDYVDGAISADAYRSAVSGLKDEIGDLRRNTELTAQQHQGLAAASAMATRALNTMDGVASRLGIAQQMQIALANQFGQTLRGFGPAGQMAAGGLGLIQGGLASLTRPLQAADLGFSNILKTAMRLPQLLGLALGAGLAGGVVMLTRAANEAAKLAEQLEVATHRTGLGIEAFQEYTFAAQQTGVEIGLLTTTMQRLQRRAADANAGNKGLAEAFKALNVQLTDSNGNMRGTEDLLDQVADGLLRVDNNAEKLRLAFKIFDTEGARLLPLLSKGSEGMAELRQQARELGLVISGDAVMSLRSYKQEMDLLQRQIQTARVEIAAAFLPVLRDVLVPLIQNRLVPLLQEAAAWVKDFADRFTDTTEAGREFRNQIVALYRPLLTFGDVIIGVGQGFASFVQMVLGGAAGLGAALGTLSVQVQSFVSRMSTLTEGLAWWQQGNLLGALEVFQRMGSAMSDTFSRTAIIDAFDAATSGYLDNAVRLATAGQERIIRAVTGDYEDLLESFANDLAGAVGQGVGTIAEAAVAGAGASAAAAAKRTVQNVFDDIAEGGAVANRLAEVYGNTLEAQAASVQSRINLITRGIAELVEMGLDANDDGIQYLRGRLGELQQDLRALQAEMQRTVNLRRAELANETGFRAGGPLAPTIWREMSDAIEAAKNSARLLGTEFDELAVRKVVLESKMGPLIDRTVDLTATERELLEVYGDEYKIVADLIKQREALEAATERLDKRIRSFFENATRLGVDLQGPSDWIVNTDAARDLLLDLRESRAEIEALIRQGTDPSIVQDAIRDYRKLLDSAGTDLGPLFDRQAEELMRRARVSYVAGLKQAIDENPPRLMVDFPLTPTSQFRERLGDIDATLEAGRRLAYALGNSYDELGARQRLLISSIESMSSEYKEMNPAQQDAINLAYAELAAVQQLMAARDQAAAAVERSVATTRAAVSATAQNVLDYTQGLAALAAIGDQARSAFDKPLTFGQQLQADLDALKEAKPILAFFTGYVQQLIDSVREGEIAAEFDGILASIQALGRETDPLAGLREAISNFADQGGSESMVEALEAAMGDAMTRLAGLPQLLDDLARLSGESRNEFQDLAEKFIAAADAGALTNEELQDLLATIRDLEAAAGKVKLFEDITSKLDLGTAMVNGLNDAIAGIRDGDLQGALGGLTTLGQAIGTAIGGSAVGALVGAIGSGLQAVVGLFRTISDLFTGDSEARRQLAKSLQSTVASSFRNGILEGMKGGEDWQQNLRRSVTEAVLGAVIDAFIQAAIIQAIFQPFLDEFTKALQRGGIDAALEVFDRDFARYMDQAMDATERFVQRTRQYVQQLEHDIPTPTAGVFDLPNATVSVLASPEWVGKLDRATARLEAAGEAMLTAAEMMQETFNAGLPPVRVESTRGIDAQRAL